MLPPPRRPHSDDGDDTLLDANLGSADHRVGSIEQRFEAAAGGYRLDVQGLHVTCEPASGPLRNIIEPLPDPARGSTLNTLVATLS